MKNVLSIFVVLLFHQAVISQQHGENPPSFSDEKADFGNQLITYWENDMFLRTDYYFTNGSAFQLISDYLRFKRIEQFLSTPFTLDDRSYSLTVRQNMYTPEKMSAIGVQQNDRPYAGYMIVDYKLSSENSRRRFSSSLTVGILGEYSLASRTQNFVHSMDHLNEAQGWEYQVNNAPVINLNYRHDHKLVRSGVFDLQYTLIGRLGSLYTDGEFNTTIRIGKLQQNFDYTAALNKGRQFELYMYTTAGAKLSYYDATLQGSIFGYKPNSHYFTDTDRHLLLYNLTGGIVFSYKFIRVRTSITSQTPEFKGGKSHGWGELSIGVAF